MQVPTTSPTRVTGKPTSDLPEEGERYRLKNGIYKVVRSRTNGKITLRFERRIK